jgi:ClpP class serine protease
MGLLDLFWILFIISAFSPLIQRRILESKRIATLRKIETSRGSRVIGLIHRQETLSLFGFPLMRYIDIQDSEEVIRAIKMTDDAIPIDIILHTPGGLVLASEQIAQALLRHPAKVTVFIPHYAMSGGTLIALACDEIVMDENAVLGPVDPQVGRSVSFPLHPSFMPLTANRWIRSTTRLLSSPMSAGKPSGRSNGMSSGFSRAE